jgi:hypothetical protein
VRGVVRDAESGLPIHGAQIATSWTLRDHVSTGADGSYQLDGLGDRGELYVRAADYADTAETLPRTGELLQVDFALTRGSSVIGRILRTDGGVPKELYVAAAATQFLGSGGSHTHWRPARVGPDGRFRIDGLATTRRWQLYARADDSGAEVWSLPPSQLLAGPRDLGDLVLPEPALLEGRFVDGDGQPIARAEVTLSWMPDQIARLLPEQDQPQAPLYPFGNRETRTGSDGTFRLGGLGEGSYSVTARIDEVDWSVESGPHAVAAGALVVVPDLVADRGLTIEGSVPLALLRGLPAGERLSLYAAPADGEPRQASIGADGRFVIERLASGEHKLFALDVPQGLAFVPRVVTAGSRGVTIDLVAADTIEGRVVDAAGVPQPRVEVHFFPAGVIFSRNEFTDAEGRFRLVVAPGAIGNLGAADPEHMFRQVQVDGVVAGTKDLRLQLPAR